MPLSPTLTTRPGTPAQKDLVPLGQPDIACIAATGVTRSPNLKGGFILLSTASLNKVQGHVNLNRRSVFAGAVILLEHAD